MLCGLSAALSVIVTAATRAPPAVGLNVTVIVQFALAARDEPQVLVSVKSPGLAPPSAMLVIASAVPPLFVTVTICDALDMPETVATNVSVFAESIAVGCTWPVPIRAMECGFPGASSSIVIEADLAPAAAGVNFTLKVQTALTAIDGDAIIRLREVACVCTRDRNPFNVEDRGAGVGERHHLRGALRAHSLRGERHSRR